MSPNHNDQTVEIQQAVYIVDDDLIIRKLLMAMLEEADIPAKPYASAELFLLEYHSENAGCILLDIMMPGMNGMELHKVISAHGNSAPVIFLTGVADVAIAVEALKAGAMDLIEKPLDKELVLSSIDKALTLDLENRRRLIESQDIQRRFLQLTPRECEVMAGIVDGQPNKRIANDLGISSRTVEVHRRNIFEKMQADSIADLVKMSIRIKR